MRLIQIKGPCHRILSRSYSSATSKPAIIQIKNGTFYRHHPSSLAAKQANPALFKDLNFELPSFSEDPHYWAILGPSSAGKTTFLQILRGQYLSFPPTARSYPYLNSEEIDQKNHELRIPSRAIQYVGFGGEQGVLSGQGTRGAYLSARYEAHREATDWSVLNYLQGRTELNPSEEEKSKVIDEATLQRVVKDLRLRDLIDMPVSNLSNGQTRRAKIARALLGKPEVLLLDEPLMGLDPPTLMSLSPLLHGLAKANDPRLILSLRPQDPIPDWITHLMYLRPECEIALKGTKEEVLSELKANSGNAFHIPIQSLHEIGRTLTDRGILEPETSEGTTPTLSSTRGDDMEELKEAETGEVLIDMDGVRVAYGPKVVLGNWTQDVDGQPKKGLHWKVRRGQRWGIIGANGSGKTTILSLICSDHPQTYSQPVKLFGRSRLPEPGKPGISIFDIQARIGHSSPEIHHHIPRNLTLRQTLENAWAETFQGIAKLDKEAVTAVEACLKWFEHELRPGAAASDATQSAHDSTSWASEYLFHQLPFSSQRVALFLRAIIKKPDLVILDESFGGMDETVRDKCMLFLAHGETKTFQWKDGLRGVVESDVARSGNVAIGGLGPEQALLCISHVREEIPGCVREWVCLPESTSGIPPRFGRLDGPLDGDSRRWNQIWGM